MNQLKRRVFLAALAAGTIGLSGWGTAQAQAPASIKIGYAVSKTGPNAAGAGITTIPNYELWVKEINAAGGIMLKSAGKRVPVEVVEYDDRSSSEEAVKAIERLATQDKVDILLSPWGTAMNLAVGPAMNKYGYPHLAATAVTDRAPDLVKRWPNSFWFLGTSAQYAEGAVALLSKLRSENKIGNNIAMASVADGFGIDLSSAARKAFANANFKLVYDKSYPLGTQDLASVINDVKAANADAFVAFSYPPDSFGLTEQSRVLGFNPKVFYVGVGTAFPVYKAKFGDAVEGVLGIGGWNAESPKIKDYLKRHVAATGKEPDRWASAVTFASLEMLKQAIERVGKIDRAAITKELQTGTFDTVVGTVKLKNNMPENLWTVGQWQGGEFYGLAPTNLPGARPALFPKPAWKAPAK